MNSTKLIKLFLGAALVLILLTATTLVVSGQPQTPDPVTIGITPSLKEVVVGDIFTVDITIDAGAQPVSSVQAFVDFDPTYLRVVDAAGNPTDKIEPVTDPFETVMLNRADNAAGEIDYAAGTFGTAPTGSFVLATIRFEALNGTAETRLKFSTTPPRETKAKHGTDDLPVELSDGTATIYAGMIGIGIEPSLKEVSVGDIFTVTVGIEAGTQEVGGVETYMDFDPTYLNVVDAAGNPTDKIEPVTDPFETVLQNGADNIAGEIDYAAGTFGTAPTGSFDIATIRFKALTTTTGVHVAFVLTEPRKTIASFDGERLAVSPTDGTVAIYSLPEIITVSLLDGKVGEYYEEELEATGGKAPYTWSIIGVLPLGLELDDNTISGTPTKDGEFTFTVQVTDDLGKTDSKELSLAVSPRHMIYLPIIMKNYTP